MQKKVKFFNVKVTEYWNRLFTEVVSILGNIKNPVGYNPVQGAVADARLQRCCVALTCGSVCNLTVIWQL